MRLASRSGESYLGRSGAGRALRLSDSAVERRSFPVAAVQTILAAVPTVPGCFGRSTTCLDSVRALDWQRGLVRCAAHCLPGRPLQRLESSGHAEVWLEAAKAAVAAELRGAACTGCPLGTTRPTAALHALGAGLNRRWCPRSQSHVGLGRSDATLSEGRLCGFCSGQLELLAWLLLVQATRMYRVSECEHLFAALERYGGYVTVVTNTTKQR
jgi:hypothetical protein